MADTLDSRIVRVCEPSGEQKTGQGVPVAFFDRDGVLNIDQGSVCTEGDFQWVPGSREALMHLHELGYTNIVTTNQAGIARGYYEESSFRRLARAMLEQAAIDWVFYCPFHPESSNPVYALNCSGRKPGDGMLRQAESVVAVDRERSFLIGDRSRDLGAAEKFGIAGHHFPGGNLLEFVRTILGAP